MLVLCEAFFTLENLDVDSVQGLTISGPGGAPAWATARREAAAIFIILQKRRCGVPVCYS